MGVILLAAAVMVMSFAEGQDARLGAVMLAAGAIAATVTHWTIEKPWTKW